MAAGLRRLWKTIGHSRWWARFILLLAVFIAWTGFGVYNALFGVVGAGVAATVSFRLRRDEINAFRLMGLIRFVPYFFWVSIRGGIDVSKRAFSPAMPLDPGFIDYHLRITGDGAAAVFFGCVISLVPGTLCVELDGQGAILIHVVDLSSDVEQELQLLERRVAAIFGERLT